MGSAFYRTWLVLFQAEAREEFRFREASKAEFYFIIIFLLYSAVCLQKETLQVSVLAGGGIISFKSSISLRSKRSQSSYCAKVRAEAKKRWFLRSPPPPPSFIFFFCSCPSFLDEPREETLATQASLPCYEHIRPGHLFLCAYCMFHSISGISSSLHFRVLS